MFLGGAADHWVILCTVPCVHNLDEQANPSQSGWVSCLTFYEEPMTTPQNTFGSTYRKAKFCHEPEIREIKIRKG